MLGGDPVPLPERVHRSFQFVRAGLRDHVDEAAGRAAELGRRALVDDHHLLDRVLVESERRALAAPLLAEERVVEVGAVDDEVVEDAALAADVQLIAVGPLGERSARCEQGQVEEVPAVHGQPLDHLVGEPLGGRHVFGRGRPVGVRRHRDLLGDDLLELDVEVQALADTKRQAGEPFHQSLVVPGHDQFVRPERQQRAGKGAGGRRLHGCHESRLGMLDQHLGAPDSGSVGPSDRAADDAGRRLGLGGRGRGHRRARGQTDNDE